MREKLINILDIEFKYLNKHLVKIILGLVLRIDLTTLYQDKSEVTVENLGANDEYLHIVLAAKNRLRMEITLHQNIIDMYVGEEKEVVYEMSSIHDFTKFEKQIKKWFCNDLYQKKLVKNSKVLYNQFCIGDSSVVYQSTNLSYCFLFQKKFDDYSFKSWVAEEV